MGPIKTSVEDIKIPDIPMPDISMPDISMPDIVMPVFQMIDLLIIAALVFGFAVGTHRGMVREVVGLCLVTGAYLVTNISYETLITGFGSLTENVDLARIFAYATAFIGYAVSLSVAFHMVTKVVEVKEATNLFDRGGGAIFGTVKLALLVSIGLFIIHADPDGRKDYADAWFMVKLAPLWEPLSIPLMSDLPPPTAPLAPETNK